MLIFESVVKRYGRQHALGPVSLRIQEGRIVALTGPAGAGKTTLIRLALGLITPEAGIVIVGGIALTAARLTAVRRRIGYVPQGGGLFPHLTVAENIELATRAMRWSRDKRTARLTALCDSLRFSSATLARYPRHLSDGERSRVAVLRAMMLDPDLLLIDDPLAGLDRMSRHAIRTELGQILRGFKKATLFVSEELSDCGAVSDDIVLLRAGLVVQRGTLRDFVTEPANLFVSEFVRAQHGPADG